MMERKEDLEGDVMPQIHIIFICYLLFINLTAFAMMGTDKRRARKHQWRIPEKSLFLSALLGGSPGALAGMYTFHHKTKHWYFVVGMPLIVLLQLGLALYFFVLT